jgi:hypothetical protein
MISVSFNEPCPCDNCHHKYKCEESKLACRSFCYFVIKGVFNPEAPKVPTKEEFNRVFKWPDAELARFLKSENAKGQMK